MDIVVIGYSGNINESPVKELQEEVYRLGYLIAKKGHTLWNGGRDGIMEIVSKGASEAGGDIVGILPWDKKQMMSTPSQFVKRVVYTGLDFSMRSIVLVNNADLIISVGGGSGTATEIFAAYGYAKPIVLYANSGGWTQKIAQTFKERENPVYLDHRKTAPVFIEKTLDGIVKHL